MKVRDRVKRVRRLSERRNFGTGLVLVIEIGRV